MAEPMLPRPELVRRVFGTKLPKLMSLEPKHVPPRLHHLIDYATVWGSEREEAEINRIVDVADGMTIRNLVAVVDDNIDEIEQWLAGPEADSLSPTEEYLSFTSMMMAVEYARAVRLR